MEPENPMIDEVRAARDAIARAHDYDVARIMEALVKREKECGTAVVHLPARRPKGIRKAG